MARYSRVVGYQRRIIDILLDELIPELAAIALEGAKGVGKTATAMQRANTKLSFTNASERGIVSSDPDGVAVVPLALLGP